MEKSVVMRRVKIWCPECAGGQMLLYISVGVDRRISCELYCDRCGHTVLDMREGKDYTEEGQRL
jgi:Zn finger protein HypA/HybF involved in hydrogenase expression